MELCMWGCGQPGKFNCTSYYGMKKAHTKCCERWNQCPANKAAKLLSAQKANETKAKKGKEGSNEMQRKRKETLAKIDENGISGFRRNALAVAAARREADGTYRGIDKTVETKRAIKDENGLDIYQKTAIKVAITRFGYYGGESRKWKINDYRRKVSRATFRQPLHLLPDFEKRGSLDRNKDAYHIDHIISVSFGFDNNIDPEIIGHFENLRMLPAHENHAKMKRCDMGLEELLFKIQSSAIICAAAESNPAISSIPASDGSAIEN